MNRIDTDIINHFGRQFPIYGRNALRGQFGQIDIGTALAAER